MSEERILFGYLITVAGLAWIVVLANQVYGVGWKAVGVYFAIMSLIDFGRWIRKP